MFKHEMELAIKLALEAGEKIMEIYETDFKVYSKEDKSPLTEADLEANNIIVKGLKENFPKYSILSEESKDDKTRLDNHYCFIVDPIDGTKEFVNKNGEFTVNIALSYKHKSIMGVIFSPVLNKLYYAYQGSGTYLSKVENYKVIGTKKISVTNKTNNLNLVGSKSHQKQEFTNLYESNIDRISNVVSAGSSLKGCLVAEGIADIYYRFGYTSEWDTCAMQCVVEEAGAIFKQMDKTDMTYNRGNNLNDKGFFIVNNKENILI